MKKNWRVGRACVDGTPALSRKNVANFRSQKVKRRIVGKNAVERQKLSSERKPRNGILVLRSAARYMTVYFNIAASLSHFMPFVLYFVWRWRWSYCRLCRPIIFPTNFNIINLRQGKEWVKRVVLLLLLALLLPEKQRESEFINGIRYKYYFNLRKKNKGLGKGAYHRNGK